MLDNVRQDRIKRCAIESLSVELVADQIDTPRRRGNRRIDLTPFWES